MTGRELLEQVRGELAGAWHSRWKDLASELDGAVLLTREEAKEALRTLDLVDAALRRVPAPLQPKAEHD